MGLIQANAVVVKTTTARLKADDIKKLIAADMGVDPSTVSLKFDISYNYSDYNSGTVSSADFSAVDVTVTERKV